MSPRVLNAAVFCKTVSYVLDLRVCFFALGVLISRLFGKQITIARIWQLDN